MAYSLKYRLNLCKYIHLRQLYGDFSMYNFRKFYILLPRNYKEIADLGYFE